MEKRTKNNGDMQSLPEELIFKIFLRVPAQPLFSIKSFCRNWYQIVRDPRFVLTHTRQAKPRLIFLAQNDGRLSTLKLVSLEVSRDRCNRPIALLQEMCYLKYNRQQSLSIRASCDGLLLMENSSPAVNRQVIIFNPVTKQFCRIPPSSLCIPTGPLGNFHYGFAFDEKSRRYKVVHMLRDDNNTLLCNILTLGSFTWRQVQNPEIVHNMDFNNVNYKPTVVGGIVHWVTGHIVNWPNVVFDPTQQHRIVSLDISSERFRNTRLPEEAKGACRLLEMGGHLGLLDCRETKLDIWVLEDYEREVWVKRHTTTDVFLVDLLVFHGLLRCFEPIACLDDGKVVVFKQRTKLYIYDLENGTCDEVNTHMRYISNNPRIFLLANPCTHVDTLVSW